MLKGQFGPIHVHSSSMYNDNDMHEAGYIAYEGEVTTLVFPMFDDVLPIPWSSRADIESYMLEFMNWTGYYLFQYIYKSLSNVGYH